MKRFHQRATLTALPIILSAGAASADVTAQDVWNAIQGQLTGMGYQAQVDFTTDTPQAVAVSAAHFSNPAYKGGKIDLVLHGLRLNADGKGGVDADYSNMSATLDVTNPAGSTIEADLGFGGVGYAAHYTGNPGDISGTFSGPAYSVKLNGFKLDDTAYDVTADITLHDSKGTVHYSGGDAGNPVRVDSDVTASAITFKGDFNDPTGEPSKGSMNGSMADVSVSGSNLGGGGGGQVFSAVEGKSQFSYGKTTFDGTLSGKQGDMNVNATVASGFIQSQVDQGRLSYDQGSKDVALKVTGSVLPMPSADVAIASSETHVALPLKGSPDPQSVALKVAVDGVTVGDALWKMIEPSGTLQNQPAAFTLDLTGEVVLPQDLQTLTENPQAMMQAMNPGSLKSLVLKSLLIRALGAEISATGQATFDPSMPIPTGALDVTATGLQTVIGQLSKVGWLDQNSAGMAGMMIGMYAVPGDKPDTLVSHVEVSPQGVMVNGKPLQ